MRGGACDISFERFVPGPGRCEAEPVAGEWASLWSDDSLDGWIWHGPGAMDAVWSIADGVVSCEGSPIGYIRTEAEFTNFELEVEWRFDPARGAGNSGVLLRMIGEDEVWLVVRRTIDGATARHVEVMEAAFRTGTEQAAAFFVDDAQGVFRRARMDDFCAGLKRREIALFEICGE